MPVLKHLAYIENAFDPRVAQTFKDLSNGQDNAANLTGVSGIEVKAPPAVRSIAVAALNGVFDIVITDPTGQAGQSQGINYFLDFDTSPTFANARTIHLGPSRSFYGFLGNLTFYFRAYSQVLSSPRSAYIIYGGSTPIGTAGGGAAGPAPMKTTGSGGKGGKGGFGGH
jgi:hypothetical protein